MSETRCRISWPACRSIPDIPFSISWSGRMSSSDLTLNESRSTVSGSYKKLGYSIEHQQLEKSYFKSSASNLEEMKLTLSYDLPGGGQPAARRSGTCQTASRKRDSATAAAEGTGGIQNCLTFNLDYDRDLESDRDITSSDQFMLTDQFQISWFDHAEGLLQALQALDQQCATAREPTQQHRQSGRQAILSA